MSQQPVSTVQSKRPTMLYVALAIAVVVIIVLAAMTVLFYMQSKDYHDSKYRAQYVIVDRMTTAVNTAGTYIAAMLVNDTTYDVRMEYGNLAQATLQELSTCAQDIQAMYWTSSENNETFGMLATAFANLKLGVAAAQQQMTENTPGHLIDPAEWVALNDAGGYLNAIDTALTQGIDPAKNAYDSPYSIVSGMDLVALRDASQSIIDLFPSAGSGASGSEISSVTA